VTSPVWLLSPVAAMSHSFLTALKPSYLFAPKTLARRIWMQFYPPGSSPKEVRLPWGTWIEVEVTDTIGGAIYRQGIFDLGVSECAWRLLRPGDQVVDAGANIGYMTGLFAARTGRQGTVHAFEPHPQIRKKLEANVSRIARNETSSKVVVHAVALGDRNGTADLVEADNFTTNQGTSFLADAVTPAVPLKRHRVEVKTLDEVFPAGEFGLLKIDVEGHESKLIKGATRLLSGRRIRNVIYEDHAQGQSGIPEIFAEHGYKIYSIGHTFFGLELTDLRRKIVLDTSWESPSYLATIDPAYVDHHIRKGWKIFKGASLPTG